MKNWSTNLKHFPEMREVGKLTYQCLQEIKKVIQPGITTADIEENIIDYQKKHNLKNSQYGFHGFPAYACIGKNNVLCHGIPSRNVILNEGDIVKVDVTFSLDGFHGDAAKTFPVGEIDDEAHELIHAAQSALKIGLSHAYAGNMTSDIGAAIESYVIKQKKTVARNFTGHGIFREMHDSSIIIRHFWDPEASDQKLVPGMTFTIEPIICARSPRTKVESDKWTTVTLDQGWSAQEEVTIGLTEEGTEIFTR